MANKHQKLKIQLTDDLGNTKTITEEDAAHTIMENILQDHFAPCDICSRYILFQHINLTKEQYPIMYCNHCTEEIHINKR